MAASGTWGSVDLGGTIGTLHARARLRLAYWKGAEKAPGTVILVQGRGEYLEVYGETVADFCQRGFAVMAYDHRDQGGSQRRLRRGGHVGSYKSYAEDLVSVVRFAGQLDLPRPFYIVAHSMGGLVALTAAPQLVDDVARMVLLAPALGLERLPMPSGLVEALTSLSGVLGLDRTRVGKPVVPATPFADNRISSDPARYRTLTGLAAANPDLTVGAPTLGWVRATLTAARRVRRDIGLPLAIPSLFIASGRDEIVSTPVIDRFARSAPGGGAVLIPGARHQVLLERDELRDLAFAALDAFIFDTEAAQPAPRRQGAARRALRFDASPTSTGRPPHIMPRARMPKPRHKVEPVAAVETARVAARPAPKVEPKPVPAAARIEPGIAPRVAPAPQAGEVAPATAEPTTAVTPKVAKAAPATATSAPATPEPGTAPATRPAEPVTKVVEPVAKVETSPTATPAEPVTATADAAAAPANSAAPSEQPADATPASVGEDAGLGETVQAGSQRLRRRILARRGIRTGAPATPAEGPPPTENSAGKTGEPAPEKTREPALSPEAIVTAAQRAVAETAKEAATPVHTPSPAAAAAPAGTAAAPAPKAETRPTPAPQTGAVRTAAPGAPSAPESGPDGEAEPKPVTPRTRVWARAPRPAPRAASPRSAPVGGTHGEAHAAKVVPAEQPAPARSQPLPPPATGVPYTPHAPRPHHDRLSTPPEPPAPPAAEPEVEVRRNWRTEPPVEPSRPSDSASPHDPSTVIPPAGTAPHAAAGGPEDPAMERRRAIARARRRLATGGRDSGNGKDGTAASPSAAPVAHKTAPVAHKAPAAGGDKPTSPGTPASPGRPAPAAAPGPKAAAATPASARAAAGPARTAPSAPKAPASAPAAKGPAKGTAPSAPASAPTRAPAAKPEGPAAGPARTQPAAAKPSAPAAARPQGVPDKPAANRPAGPATPAADPAVTSVKGTVDAGRVRTPGEAAGAPAAHASTANAPLGDATVGTAAEGAVPLAGGEIASDRLPIEIGDVSGEHGLFATDWLNTQRQAAAGTEPVNGASTMWVPVPPRTEAEEIEWAAQHPGANVFSPDDSPSPLGDDGADDDGPPPDDDPAPPAGRGPIRPGRRLMPARQRLMRRR